MIGIDAVVVPVFRFVVLVFPPAIQGHFFQFRLAGTLYKKKIAMGHPTTLQVDTVNVFGLFPGWLKGVNAPILVGVLFAFQQRGLVGGIDIDVTGKPPDFPVALRESDDQRWDVAGRQRIDPIPVVVCLGRQGYLFAAGGDCLLYTSDAADE